MALTRRRVLVALGGMTAVAGCNTDDVHTPQETLTPVAVPQSGESLLAEAAGIDRPTLPASIPVTDRHATRAIEQAEGLLADASTAVEATVGDGPAEAPANRGGPDPDTLLAVAREHLATARDSQPSHQLLVDCRRSIGRSAYVIGYVQGRAGEVDTTALAASLAETTHAIESLRGSVTYRVEPPASRTLPQLYWAEQTLHEATDESADSPRWANQAGAGGDAGLTAGRLQWLVETRRRLHDDARLLLEETTDPNLSPRDERLHSAIETVREEIRVEVPTGEEIDGVLGPLDRSVSDDVQRARLSMATLRTIWLRRSRERERSGDLVAALLPAARFLLHYRAVDAAASRTQRLVSGHQFPAAAVLEEKHAAIDAIERVGAASPLARWLAADSQQALRFGDRVAERGQAAHDGAVMAYFRYVSAREIASRAVQRGAVLSAAVG